MSEIDMSGWNPDSWDSKGDPDNYAFEGDRPAGVDARVFELLGGWWAYMTDFNDYSPDGEIELGPFEDCGKAADAVEALVGDIARDRRMN